EGRKPRDALGVDLGWVARARIEAVVRERRKQISVEDVLVDKGLLRPADLAAARDVAARTPGRTVGRQLVESGVLAERDYLEAYAERHDVPFVEADFTLVDPEVLKRVSLPWTLRNRIIPLS